MTFVEVGNPPWLGLDAHKICSVRQVRESTISVEMDNGTRHTVTGTDVATLMLLIDSARSR